MQKINLKGKTVFITGVAGFIGANLAKTLLKNIVDIKIVGIDNLNDYYDVELKNARLNILKKYKNFSFYRMDIVNKNELLDLFDSNKFDIVINLAAQAGVRYSIDHPDSYINSNIIGFFNILECCRAFPVKHLLFASSSSVYGKNKKVPYKTTDNVDHPVSLYAATKKSDELLAYAYSNLYNIKVTGLRFFTVYGPFGRPDMAYFSFTNDIIDNKVIKVFNNGDMYRDFTYIDDVVTSIINLLDKVPLEDENGVAYKIYNIGNNNPVKISDFIEILEKELKRKAKKIYLPMQPGDVYETYADINDLKKMTGFAPKTSLNEGLHKFVVWYKDFYRGDKL